MTKRKWYDWLFEDSAAVWYTKGLLTGSALTASITAIVLKTSGC